MIGINPEFWNSTDRGERFVSTHGLSFTNLWDGSSAVYTHYGRPGISAFWLLDKHGNRITEYPRQFSTSGAEKLLDDLE